MQQAGRLRLQLRVATQDAQGKGKGRNVWLVDTAQLEGAEWDPLRLGRDHDMLQSTILASIWHSHLKQPYLVYLLESPFLEVVDQRELLQ